MAKGVKVTDGIKVVNQLTLKLGKVSWITWVSPHSLNVEEEGSSSQTDVI